MRQTRVFVWGSQTMLTGLFKNASFDPPPNLHKHISLLEVYRFEQCLGEKFSQISTFFSLVSSRAFRDAPHSRFWCRHLKLCLLDSFYDATFGPFSNLHTCSSLEVPCRFGQCLGWRILSICIVFSLACFHAFRDAPHSRRRCRHLKLCLLDVLKILDLAPSRIYRRVFHL